MLDSRSRKILENLILTTVVVVTLVVTPYTSADPINIPKLSSLVLFSIVSFSIVAPWIKRVFRGNYRLLATLLSAFLLQIFLILIFSGSVFEQQFLGTYGRNTGALTYISLTFLLFATSLVATSSFLKRFIVITLSLGALLIFYGQIQHQGWEPLPYVNAYASNVIGTFGNPDFMSAFMGLIGAVAFTMVLNTRFKLWMRFSLGIAGIWAIVIVYETHAKQGYLNFLAGVGVVAILWLFMNKHKLAGFTLSGLAIVGSGLVFFGLINAGPLASYLYKSSLQARGFYWRAGINMLIEHPFFGVGMDGYGDWYRRARSLEDTLVSPGLASNTAHNVFIDIASNGGFPLLAVYLAIAVLVVVSIVRVVRRANGFDVYFASIVGAWVAYQAQSFVSINQLALAVWGWVLSGWIVGYEINTRSIDIDATIREVKKTKGRNAKIVQQSIPSVTVMAVFGGIAIGALVALPPYVSAAKYFKTLKTGDAKLIQEAAYLKPYDSLRFLQVASTLRDNKLESEAISVIKDAAEKYPDSFEVWSLWASIPTAAPADIAYAQAQLRRLDPHNPNLK